MYFYQKFQVNSNKYQFFNCQFSYILIFSFFSYKIIAKDFIYFYVINNYNFSICSKRFLKVLIFIIMLHNLDALLEVKINNFRALSLYYWLGFAIVHIRFYYYMLNRSKSSAYSLFNTKSISQNIFRRYLIFNIY
uniref:hypothetical protein n=1 Tax=Gracilaria flabelliformis subsp. simplex TaxID=1638138 RepID=UPI001D11BD22|nr:hypothetical protein LK244_pgp027 [Gracilaria flabelliformis subsp. simplex]UAD86082.1 hypothetical protein [Gracilaria flabelliformis subsp. simplex]